MIFHKRKSPNRPAPFKRWCASVSLIVALHISTTIVDAGTYSNVSFPVVKDGIRDSSVENKGSLNLGIERFTGIKVFGDSIQPQFPASIYSDVIASVNDTFSFFYLDTSSDAVYKRDVRVAGGFASLTSSAKAMDANTPVDCYLHADKGESGFLVSLIRKGAGTRRILRIGNGNVFIDCDSALTTGWMFSSMCLMEKDTFLVVYSSEMSSVKMIKVYSHGATLQVIKQITVSSDTSGGNRLMNCSVASDKKGGIFAVWSRGSPNGSKRINYQFFNRNLLALQGGVLNQNIGDNTFYYYDDSPVASIDSMKFAIVHWDSMGIMMNLIDLSSGSVTQSVSRVISAPGLKFPTIAANLKYCVIACFGDVNGDNHAGVEGLRFNILNGSPVNPNYFSYSKNINIVPMDRYSVAVNGALDTAGNFAVTWRYQNRIQGSVWSEYGVRYKSGFWTSDVESLGVANEDSIRFYPSVITATNTSACDITSVLRTGNTINSCTSSPWISFFDDSELEKNKTVNRYFQYRILVNRKINGDSLITPQISAITVPYNVQPKISSIDSIKIGNGNYDHFNIGDTINVYSRSDSVHLQVTVYDNDPSEKVYLKASWPGDGSAEELNGNFPETSTIFLHSSLKDTSTQCSVYVWDSRGWNSKPIFLNYKSKNALPQLTIEGIFNTIDGVQDTFTIADNNNIYIQEVDSIQLTYTVFDVNDNGRVMGYFYYEKFGKLELMDSTDLNGIGKICIRGDTITPASEYVYHIRARDNDTTIQYTFNLHVNHSPVFKKLLVQGKSIISRDTVRTRIGDTIYLQFSINDTDCSFGDTLTYLLRTPHGADSVRSPKTSAEIQWAPSKIDSFIIVAVHDRYGKSDSIIFFQKYPWFETDKQIFSPFTNAVDSLFSQVSLVVSSKINDTISLPIFNSGTDTLRVESIKINNKFERWFSMGLPSDTGTKTNSETELESFDTLRIAPSETKIIKCFFNADSLYGDSVLTDTFTIETNDYSHSKIPIPIGLEYNDLPKIVSINPNFSPGIPWKLTKQKVSTYTFPPHAAICIQFSEPMDTTSIQNGLTIYSRKDSLVDNTIDPLRVIRDWSQNFTKLNCYASYSKPSSAFSLFPPESLFIPTDDIAVRLSGNITDRAKTPSGPNALDVNMDFKRNDSQDDTTTNMNVDSIYFSILSIAPPPNDTQVRLKPVITLSFSASVYSESVDKVLKNNRTLIVKSKYNGGEQLDFDSINVDKNKVSFHIAQKLFYCDSVWCKYNSSSVKNSMGFQTDNNRDGIASTMFDSTDTTDDLTWSYRIKNIYLVSHQPEAGGIIKEISPAIVLDFDDVVDSLVIDTDTSKNNRSFKIGSIYEPSYSSYKSFTFINAGKSIQIQSKRKFFSRDSVFFVFSGFSKNYRYNRSVNLPGDSTENFDRYSWTFYTGNTGFYTFPNPYKPGKDPRHCDDHGPCGIWFKNLHVLKNGVKDLIVKIYSMNTHPVYNSQKAGVAIHFEENSTEYLPQWLWDTRNQKGELVASGLYFYTITDIENKILTKGKIMIVR
jgi:hypothetical protein